MIGHLLVATLAFTATVVILSYALVELGVIEIRLAFGWATTAPVSFAAGYLNAEIRRWKKS